MTQLKSEYDKILNKYFGYDALKKEQFDIINKVVNEKRDIMAILATGFGKSICFQMPHLITGKSVIIVSPLIALMTDQKSEMEKRGIPVCVLNSTNKDKTHEKQKILHGKNKIIYITPEYLEFCEDFITELNNNDAICLVCIDEAHCVSSYGFEFRQSYTKLGVFREWLPDVPILALTATATNKVRNDISRILKLNDPYILIGSFDRPNLYISVNASKKNVEDDLYDILIKYKTDYIIIYCKTRDETDNISKAINRFGIKSCSYHAGMSNTERETIQQKFIKKEIKCIVATIAFGMGINIPNVRLVIHYGCPKNIESYYQEIGRAGRDGKPSECIMFFSKKDFALNRFFLKDIKNSNHHAYMENQIRIIEKYVYSTECRRKTLLECFDGKVDKQNNCNNCDNCKNVKNIIKKDVTLETYYILKIIDYLDGKCGTNLVINILRGSKAKNITQHIKNHIFYNIGRHKSVDWWKSIVRLLINNDYLCEVQIRNRYGTVINITKKGLSWLKQIKYKNIDSKTIFKENDKIILDITNTNELCEKNSEVNEKLCDVLGDIDLDNIDLDIVSESCKRNEQNKPDNKQNKLDKHNEQNKPDNSGKKWNKEDDDLLLKDIKTKSTKDIAEIYGRTQGSIRSRLKLIAYRLYKQKVPIKKIIEETKLSEEKINEYIKKKSIIVVKPKN